MPQELSPRLNRYVSDLFAREDDVLRFVREQTAAHGLPLINLEPNEARLLQLLVLLTGAERVIEIGTLAGYSGIWITRALPPNGTLTTNRGQQRACGFGALALQACRLGGQSDRRARRWQASAS